MASRDDEVEGSNFLLELEPWRKVQEDERRAYYNWVQEEVVTRTEFSSDKYGEVFQGEPTDRGIEECLDQLFYLYHARKKLAFVEGQRNTFRHLLEAVMEFGLTEKVFLDIQEALGAESS